MFERNKRPLFREVLPAEPERVAIWLLFVGAYLADIMVTMGGQSDSWWGGLWQATIERNETIEHLLARGPWLMASFCLLTIALAYFLSRVMPTFVGLLLALWCAQGHSIAASRWFDAHSGRAYAMALIAAVAVLAVAAGAATVSKGRARMVSFGLSVIVFACTGAGVAIVSAWHFDRESVNDLDAVALSLADAGATGEAERLATTALEDPRMGSSGRYNLHMVLARVAAMKCDRDGLGRHLAAALAELEVETPGRSMMLGYAHEEAGRLYLSVGDSRAAKLQFALAAEAFESFARTPGIENASQWQKLADEARSREQQLSRADESGVGSGDADVAMTRSNLASRTALASQP